MKTKLHFTINSLLKNNACNNGLELLKNYLEKNNIQHDNDTKFNILMLLESNNIHHTIWALRATLENSKSISVEIAKRAATRAEKYADTAARAADAADAGRAARAAADAADAARAAAYAADAARAASYAADAADAAARYSETKKQKQDLLEILEND